MNEVTLVLYILGLSGIVTFNDHGRQGVDIVMPTVNAQETSGSPAHTALLNLKAGSGIKGAYLLDQHAITVQCAVAAPSTGDRLGVQLADSGADARTPWRSLRWAADLTKIVTAPRLKPGWMTGGGGTVTAALRFMDGRLEAAPPFSRSLEETVWKFGTATQSLTDRLRFTLRCPGDAVELHLYPFAGGAKTVLRLRPDANRLIQATVSYLPKNNGSMKSHSSTSVESLPHFGAIYALLENPPASRVIPSVAERLCPMCTEDDPPHCGPPTGPIPWPDPIPDMLPRIR
jgi:hypothetical protein